MPNEKKPFARRVAIALTVGLAGLALAAVFESRKTMARDEPLAKKSGSQSSGQWRAVHLMAPGRDGLPLLKRAIEEKLAPWGVNAVILEVNYNFDFKSHPELRGNETNAWRVEDARELAEVCRKHGVRLVPMFNCLGHQSWARNTFALLTKHPDFDESPAIPKDNPGIYCRSWCPQNPDVNKVVFDLIDELSEAFGGDAFHVGMDEVFIVGDASCPRCKGKDTAELFAKAVNDLHGHITGKRKLTMMMWADRLLDDKKLGYGKWESSANGTAGAIDRIPKDIIMCDWHYETRKNGYPSVAYLQEKGFGVLPSSWHNKDAALAMLREARAKATPRLLGHLCTTWTSAQSVCRAILDELPPEPAKPKTDAKEKAKTKNRRGGPREIAAALKACMDELKQESPGR
jgi:Glycosyl hydrolase family 20, catalytic domain